MKIKKNILVICILSLLIFISGCSEESNITSIIDGILPVNVTNDKLITQELFDYCSSKSYGDECYVVHKFGENAAVSTTTEPISNNGIYMTPINLTTLSIVSTNINDNINGIGARTVKIIGLSNNWERVEEIIELNGTTPVPLQNWYYRVYRMSVITSGTYASQNTGSHQGDIILSDGVNNWAEIYINGVALGQTEIGVYTVPQGYTAHIGNAFVHINGNKVGNIYMFIREKANQTTAPFSARTIRFQAHGVLGPLLLTPKSYSGAIPEITDFGFMGNTDVGTTETSVDFEILLLRND